MSGPRTTAVGYPAYGALMPRAAAAGAVQGPLRIAWSAGFVTSNPRAFTIWMESAFGSMVLFARIQTDRLPTYAASNDRFGSISRWIAMFH